MKSSDIVKKAFFGRIDRQKLPFYEHDRYQEGRSGTKEPIGGGIIMMIKAAVVREK
jgi:hypothetical protein